MSNLHPSRRLRGRSLRSLLHGLFVIPGDSGRGHVYPLLVVYLAVVFLCGGGARADIQSLVFLRPFSILVGGLALLTLRIDDLRRYRFLSAMAALLLILGLLHILPLPPGLWQTLPGRDIVAEMERAAGISGVWRPISLAPIAAENAFFSLLVPLAALLLVVQLDADYQRRLIKPLLVIGVVSGLVGIFQIVGDPKGALYLYRITNNGQSVGLFSNRNHQAVFLAAMFPLIALFASQTLRTDDQIKTRLVICTSAGAILVPLILVTGSRQGLVLGTLAIGLAFWIYERPKAIVTRRRGEEKSFGTVFLAIFAALLLAVITAMASRAEALNRLIETDLTEEGRGRAWKIVADSVGKYFPAGSGAGTFVEVYQIAEPLKELRPTYFNHAHNDFLEVALTYGAPGILLLVVALVAFARSSFSVIRRRKTGAHGERLSRAGFSIVLLIGLASFVDYPLRTPSIACFFVISCAWIYAARSAPENSTGVVQKD